MYRFRSIEGLIGRFNELGNQEIYFAHPEELNDPMEGYKDVFWKGDTIVWKNLIINYIKCVEHISRLNILLGESKTVDENDIPSFRKLLKYNYASRGLELVEKVIHEVFKNESIDALPNDLACRTSPIRRLELLTYLQLIHQQILASIAKVYFENGLTNNAVFSVVQPDMREMLAGHTSVVSVVNQLERENNAEAVEDFLLAINQYTQVNALRLRIEHSDLDKFPNKLFLNSDLPDKFLQKIVSELYPVWYSASFLSICNNSAIWGHYGNNHKGVCLKFKTDEKEGKLFLELETEYGFNGQPIIGMRPHEFKKVKYQRIHTEVDFFRSIGRMSKFELEELWYKDEEGNISPCGNHLGYEGEEWRDEYWNNFESTAIIKLCEWEYEKEYRLVIDSNFVDYSDKIKRKLKYNFNSLEAIIFGINTSVSDKMKIMNVIRNKCKENNRNTFDFYQAYYSKKRGQIETFKMNPLNFGAS